MNVVKEGEDRTIKNAVSLLQDLGNAELRLKKSYWQGPKFQVDGRRWGEEKGRG